MSRWTLKASAKTAPVVVEYHGLQVEMDRATPAAQRAAQALAGPVPIYGQQCHKAAAAAAEANGISIEVQLHRMRHTEPEASAAIGDLLMWFVDLKASAVAVALRSITVLDGDESIPVPKAAADRRDLLTRLAPPDLLDYAEAGPSLQGLIDACSAALNGESELDDEGKGRSEA